MEKEKANRLREIPTNKKPNRKNHLHVHLQQGPQTLELPEFSLVSARLASFHSPLFLSSNALYMFHFSFFFFFFYFENLTIKLNQQKERVISSQGHFLYYQILSDIKLQEFREKTTSIIHSIYSVSS